MYRCALPYGIVFHASVSGVACLLSAWHMCEGQANVDRVSWHSSRLRLTVQEQSTLKRCAIGILTTNKSHSLSLGPFVGIIRQHLEQV